MSILGKRRLGVSSPFTPSQPTYESPKTLSRDLEDLESLVRSLADELERAENEKRIPKSDNGGEITRSTQILATPDTFNSPMSETGEQVITPPVRHREHTSKSTPSEGRGSEEKARHAGNRERSGVSASTGSEGKRTRSEKPRRDKMEDKSNSGMPVDEKAQSTRSRSRRDGLDGASEKKKVPVKRTEMQTFIRISLLCKLSRALGLANELIDRPSPSSDYDTLYRPRTLHDPNNPHSALQLPPPLPSPTYRLFHIPLTPRHHLLVPYVPLLTP